MSLGRHIVIERRLSSSDFYCRNRITGELFRAHVGNDCRDTFAIDTAQEVRAGWCPFLRRADPGRYLCTIYDTAPRFCREFRCVTMVIRDTNGTEVGKVKGRRSLDSTDPVLTAIWQERIEGSHITNERQFLHSVNLALREHGYRAEQVE
jgi:Fe-S-cluster containining protein